MDQLSSPDSIIGTVIEGKYRVEALIGEGGMGKVFRVNHIELNRPFALKMMRFDENKTNSNRISRFRREATALARLSHPNIVSIVDFGILKTLQLPYIVMEYIEGITLRKLINTKGTLGESQAINITKQLCLGLHEAHKQGIIHRDLKPENILLRQLEDGELGVSVVDFGIAKLQIDQLPTPDSETKTTDSPPGTLRYIAPEQFFKLPIDARTDVFSICLILYEMLTGEVPPVMIGDVKTLSEMRPGATEQLSKIIEMGLSQSPNDRPESALALKQMLENMGALTLSDFIVKPKAEPGRKKFVRPDLATSTFTKDRLIDNKSVKGDRRYWFLSGLILLLICTVSGVFIYRQYWQVKDPGIEPPHLVMVKSDTFFMGSNEGDEYSRPIHSAKVARFQVARALVTNKQYAEFIKATHHTVPSHWVEKAPSAEILNAPITNVTWNDAKTYCDWLSQKIGKKYRMLSETEWEYLANHHAELGVQDIMGDFLEWTSSELSLYPEAKTPLPQALQQTSTVILRGKDQRTGSHPISDRMWQIRDYKNPRLSFRVAVTE